MQDTDRREDGMLRLTTDDSYIPIQEGWWIILGSFQTEVQVDE